MARQDDYIPIGRDKTGPIKQVGSKNASRLIRLSRVQNRKENKANQIFNLNSFYFFTFFFFREDENDLSDEDLDTQSKIGGAGLNMNYRQNMHMERQKIRENFLAYEEGFLYIYIYIFFFFLV